MKNLYIIFILSSFLVSTILANELKWVDEQIKAIKPARDGINNKLITKLKDPFIFLIKEQPKKENKKNTKLAKTKKKSYTKKTYTKSKAINNNKKINLEAIINKSALINKKWYKIGQTVQTYTIKEINSNQVILLKGSKIVILSTNTQNKTLKFNNN